MRYIKLVQNDATIVIWRPGAVGFILSVRSSLCSVMYFKNHRFIAVCVCVCVKLTTWWKLESNVFYEENWSRDISVSWRLTVWVPLQLSLQTVYSASVVSLASRAKPGTPPPVATPLTQIAFDSSLSPARRPHLSKVRLSLHPTQPHLHSTRIRFGFQE